MLDLLVHEPWREEDERDGRERRDRRPAPRAQRVEAGDDDHRDEHGTAPRPASGSEPEERARTTAAEASVQRVRSARTATSTPPVASATASVSGWYIADARTSAGDAATSTSATRWSARRSGHSSPGEEQDEDAGREPGRGGEQLPGPLRVPQAERRRQPAERAGEGEPERRRVPDAGLGLGRQPVLGETTSAYRVVRERVVAAQPVVVPGVPGEERRLRGEHRRDGAPVAA